MTDNNDDEFHRLIKVEERLRTVSEDISDMKSVLKDIANSLRALAVLEEKHNNMVDSIKRAFKAVDRLTERVDIIENSISEITSNMDSHVLPTLKDHSKKIEEVEKVMPNLKLSSSWVFKAVLAIMGLLGAASLGEFLLKLFK